MTPAQQAALEALVGRALSDDEVAAVAPLILARNDEAIAALLPATVAVVSTPIGIGTILAVLAPNGGAFLDALATAGQSDANVKWALRLIEQGNLDVGMAATRQQMQAFAQAAPDFAEGISALLKTVERLHPVSVQSVSEALNG